MELKWRISIWYFQMTRSGRRKKVVIPLLDLKGTLPKEKAEKLRADGEEEITKLLGEKGWKKEEGPCVSLVAKCKEGKVEGMKFRTEGGETKVFFEMEKIWEMEKKVRAVVKVDLDTLEFPGEGKTPRNLSEWTSHTDLEVEYFNEGKEEGVFTQDEKLSQDEEDEVGIGEKPFVMRAILIPGDSFKAALFFTVVPVAKKRLQEVLDTWGTSTKEKDEGVPGIICQRTEGLPGQEDAKDEFSHIVKILPQEQKGDKIGLGILPILECNKEDSE